MYRSVAVGTHGMVASAHPLASETGIHVLRTGGNAFDAAIAVNAVLAVTQPHMCGIGGDIFLLLYEAAGRTIHSYNGSGRSAQAADSRVLQQRGLSRMPYHGPLPITVPGCVDGWRAMHARFGSRSLRTLLEAAIDYATNGHPLSHGLASALRDGRRTFASRSDWQAAFLPTGELPAAGTRYRLPELGATLQSLASDGFAAFYEGALAARLVASARAEMGSRDSGYLLSEDDLATHQGEWVEPVSTTYREYMVYETAPNSQGVAALIALDLSEGFDLRAMGIGSADYLHTLVEAKQLAFAERNRYLTDPAFSPFPSSVLTKAYADELRRLIRPDVARAAVVTGSMGSQGDTTYFAVADEAGNLVSCIQSLYTSFGSGVVVDGVVFQNRGAYFSLADDHVNRLEPRKRTAHTLMASLVLRDGRPHLVFGSMGGDGQPQTHVQVMSNIFDFGMNIQDAIEAPRWMSGRPSGSNEPERLHVEDRVRADVLDELRKRGHDVRVEPAFTGIMGHAQGIMLGDQGELLGGADPRGDGAAIGF